MIATENRVRTLSVAYAMPGLRLRWFAFKFVMTKWWHHCKGCQFTMIT